MTKEAHGVLMVKPKQHWLRNNDSSIVKIMAVCDGYVMVRIKGCVPFVESIKNLSKKYTFIL